VWPVGSAEPSAWSLEVTDTAVTGAGVLQVTHSHSSGTHTVYADDVNVSDLSNEKVTYVPGPGGLLLTDTNGEASYPVVNALDDIVGNTDVNGAYIATPVADEFGKGAVANSRLGWLGASQRYTTHGAAGIIRMGVRLYDPSLGRFLSLDPEEGGCANDYAYVFGDPINAGDLGGAKTCAWNSRVDEDHPLTRGKGYGRAVAEFIWAGDIQVVVNPNHWYGAITVEDLSTASEVKKQYPAYAGYDYRFDFDQSFEYTGPYDGPTRQVVINYKLKPAPRGPRYGPFFDYKVLRRVWYFRKCKASARRRG
jgi:RHS repeat-associated protein